MESGRKEDADERATRQRSTGGRIVRGIGITLTALLVVLVAGIVLLQFGGISTRVVNGAAARFAPWSSVHVGHADLDGLSALTIDALRIADEEGDTLVRVDSAHLEFRLLPLLRRRLVLPRVRLVDAHVRMGQSPDSTWDLLEPFAAPDTATPAAQPAEPWRIRVGEAFVTRTSLMARFSPDSVLRIEDIELRASDIALGDELRVYLDTLGARILPPARPGSPALLSATAELADGRLVTRGIRLTSDSSNVQARGELLLPGGEVDEIEDIDFTVSATPLDFRDIGALVPGFDAPGSLRLHGRITGSQTALNVTLEAETSDGATIDVRGTLTPGLDGPVRYALTGEVADLDPGLWMDTTSAIDDVDAEFEVALAGPRLEAVSGDVRATASARLANGAIRPTTLVATFTDGVADVTLDGAASPWAAVEARGTVEPFAVVPSWDLVIDARQLDPIAAGGGSVRDMVAQVHTEGSGIAPDRTRGTARISLDGAVGRARVHDGRIDLEWADGRATADLRVPVDSGRIAGTASVDWSGDAMRIEVPSLRTERLRVAALLGDTVRSLLSADLSGSGELGRPEALDGRVEAIFEQATWGALVVDTGRVDVVAADGVIEVDGRLVSTAGRVVLDARLTPFAGTPTWSIRELTVEGLDLAAAREGLPPSDIDAAVTGEFRGSAPEALRGDATLVVDRAVVSGRTVDSARVQIDIASGRVTADGSARLLDGSLAFDASLQPFEATPTVRLEQARFEGIRLDSLAGPRLRAALSGTLTLDAAFPADTFPRANGTLALDGGAFNEGRIEEGRVEFALEDGRALLDALVTTAEGQIDIDGSAQLASGREDGGGMRLASGRVEGVVRLPDIARLAGIDTVDADLNARFAAESLPGEAAAWGLTLAAQGDYADLRVDTLRVDGRYAGGILRIDTLRIQSNAVRGGGGGVIALGEGARAVGDTLTLTLRTDSIDALEPLVGGGPLTLRSGTLTLQAVGVEQGARVDATLAAGGFIRGRTSADTVLVTGRALIADGGLRNATAEVQGERLAAATTMLQSANATVSYDSTGATFAVNVVPDDAQSLRATGHLRPDSQSVLLRQVELSMRDALWTLDDETRITWGEQITVDSLRLATGARSLFVDGRIDRTGTQDLTIRMDSVPIGDFADLAGYEDITGVASGTLRLEGPADEVDLIGDLRTTFGNATADIALEAISGERRLGLEATITDGDDDPLRVEGSLPFGLSLVPGDTVAPGGSVDLTVAADSFNIDWAAPLLQAFGLDRLEGELTGDVQVVGTWQAPELGGSARLRAGRIRMPQQGVDYRDLRASLAFEGQAIRIDTLRATADGEASISGRVVLTSLSEPELELDARLDQFHLITNQWTRLVASGSAEIGGTPLAPQVTGDITLVDTEFYGDAAGGGSAASVELTEDDYAMLESYFGYSPEAASAAETDRLLPVGLNLDVTLGPAVWLLRDAQPELRVLLTGDLDVRKEPGDSLQLFGTIEAVPERSRFEQFGRQFQVTEGTITFNGGLMSWQTNIAALYEVPSFGDPSESEVDITLAVSGGMNDLEITLGSDPSMETGDILSYIATGRPAASAIEFGSGDEGGSGGVLGTGARYALGSATTALENLAADAIGLSVVEVRQTATGTRLIAGRYVSPRLFVGFQQPLSPEDRQEGVRNEPFGTQLEVEYTAFRWLLVNLQGSSSQFRGFFRFKHAF